MLKLHKIITHTLNFDDFFNSLPGLKYIFVNNYSKDQRFLFKGAPITAFVWIPPWCRDILEKSHYIELDASFKMTNPFTYVVPQAIIQNEAIPVGLCMGPSESSKIYEIFRNGVLNSGMPEEIFQKLPTLSDEGSGVLKYSHNYHEKSFVCYCHLIRKFGSGSPAGLIAKRALFTSSVDEFEENIPQLVSDLRYLKLHKLISSEKYDDLCTFLGLICNENKEVIDRADFAYGIWKRADLCVSSCDNHSERFHGAANKRCDLHYSLVQRLSQLCNLIFTKKEKFMGSEHRQAITHFRHLQERSGKKPDCCPFPSCKWGEIWSKRYGTIAFPCSHVKINGEIEFFPKPLITDSIETKDVETMFLPETDKWHEKLGKSKKRILSDTKEQNFIDDTKYLPKIDSHLFHSFIIQVRNEIFSLRDLADDPEELLITLTRDFLEMLESLNLVHDELIARSLFRCRWWEKAIKSKK
jgi:hypothetical protein